MSESTAQMIVTADRSHNGAANAPLIAELSRAAVSVALYSPIRGKKSVSIASPTS